MPIPYERRVFTNRNLRLDAIEAIREKAEAAGVTIAAWELAAYADATRGR